MVETDKIMDQLTVEEKAALVSGTDFMCTRTLTASWLR